MCMYMLCMYVCFCTNSSHLYYQTLGIPDLQVVYSANVIVACLILLSFSMCDVNSTRRLGPSGEGADVVSDQQTPLLMSCTWGLQNVVQCLLEHNANVNVQVRDVLT